MKDFRQENPKLHHLYVVWAQQDLALINEAIEMFSQVSRVSMSIVRGRLYEERAKLLKEDVAFQEAFWWIAAGDLLIEEESESAQ